MERWSGAKFPQGDPPTHIHTQSRMGRKGLPRNQQAFLALLRKEEDDEATSKRSKGKSKRDKDSFPARAFRSLGVLGAPGARRSLHSVECSQVHFEAIADLVLVLSTLALVPAYTERATLDFLFRLRDDVATEGSGSATPQAASEDSVNQLCELFASLPTELVGDVWEQVRGCVARGVGRGELPHACV
jgi:hypothetical protein